MFLHKIYGFTGREQGSSKVPGEQNEKRQKHDRA